MSSLVSDPTFRKARAVKALGVRYGHTVENNPEFARAVALIAEYQASDYVREAVKRWPPLTPEQKHRLAMILLADGETAA